jgi:hypothetical protein
MALAREQMRRATSGGGGVAVPPPPSGMNEAELAWYLAAVDQAKKQEQWNAKANEAWNKAQTEKQEKWNEKANEAWNKAQTKGKNYTPVPTKKNYTPVPTSKKPVQSKPLYTPVSSLSGYSTKGLSTAYKPLTARDLLNNFRGLR